MNILGVATFTGAANAVAASAKALQARGHSLCLIGMDEQAEGPFKRSGLNYILLSTSQRNLVDIVQFSPDVLLLGVSRQDYPGMQVLEHIAYDLFNSNIPSVAVLDIHGEYSNRFSDYGMNDLKYLPTKVAVVDCLAREEMIREGIPEDRLVVTGNPHFYSLRREYTLEEIAETRTALKLNDSFFVLYLSDYLARAWGDNREENSGEEDPFRWQNCMEKIGYNELTVLTALTYFARLGREYKEQKLSFLLKPHPREIKEGDIHYLEMISHGTPIKILGFDTPYVNVPSPAVEVYRLVAAADLVIGAYSTVLYESLVMDPRKPVISLQPNAKYRNEHDLCTAVRMGAILPCYESHGLEAIFCETLLRDKDEQERLVKKFINSDAGANELVADLVEETAKIKSLII